MIKKTILVMIISLSCSLLSGCWDSNEPERMVYAHGIGIDYKDNRYIIQLQMIDLGGLSKLESSGGPVEEQSEVGKASGRTINEAIFNLYRSTDRRVFWGHLSFIILSESVMEQEGLKFVTDLMNRYRETRYRIWFYSTKDSIEDILLAEPIIGISIARSVLSDPENSFEQSSFIKHIALRELLLKLNEPGHEVVIPAVSVTKRWKTQKKTDDVIQLDGLTVLTKANLKGFILGEKAKGLRWMDETMHRDDLTIYKNKKPVTEAILKTQNVKIKPVISGGRVDFDIEIKLKASINELDFQVNKEFIEKEIKKMVKKEVMKTYKAALEIDADIYRFSDVLYRKNIKEWKKHQHNGKLSLDEHSIRSIKVKVLLKDASKHLLIPSV
ncbi:Ger(x)C family spore germination protein [Bacillus aquiflavi]|uniref:Ger(X)C family spore germination protein n=1 Tax=Bacillus aquiflavi TaxID=2672567 RepID=A0A6B3VYE8_9BACI|nr:Ger(x)C family spore germination protein [Bacillus aquiflavi]MBA4536942.1 Ger(x)C family spore germination protein [Bacillus aquiflavi]NEY82328.1 Ger(x)C family spore germination protein [Bacillus aquiflavi]